MTREKGGIFGERRPKGDGITHKYGGALIYSGR